MLRVPVRHSCANEAKLSSRTQVPRHGGGSDIVKEALILQALAPHRNLVECRWRPGRATTPEGLALN